MKEIIEVILTSTLLSSFNKKIVGGYELYEQWKGSNGDIFCVRTCILINNDKNMNFCSFSEFMMARN